MEGRVTREAAVVNQVLRGLVFVTNLRQNRSDFSRMRLAKMLAQSTLSFMHLEHRNLPALLYHPQELLVYTVVFWGSDGAAGLPDLVFL
jgi:hypothetical protein